MAKKKKKSGHKRPRRRVSGVHPAIMDTGMMLAGAAAGAVVATFGANGIKTAASTMPAWVGGGAMAAIGAAVPLFTKMTPFTTGAALGMAGVGAALAINETFISLPGISGVPANNGLVNSKPGNGYFNNSVGTAGYKGLAKRTMGGTFSGNGSSAVGAIVSN